ncbi:BMC domain-containing protein [Dehalobacterium formicoaceticum]|uniref:BMC domain-containing protein n=1 Tax=Dehalobacterium formicoaceticum TaxID=51515 RepID=UPI000B7FCC6E|nr:BMC domain-containing protein [Dehalobacterium formicoaceticum]
MKNQALGMIETRGLVPAIEAGDAGVKAANVKLLGYEIVEGGLIMVAFAGDVAAVQASVSAGSAAAAKVGLVISQHVIPRPEVDIKMVFKGKLEKPKKPEDDPIPPHSSGHTCSDANDEFNQTITNKEAETEGSFGVQEGTEENDALAFMTVGELRRLARETQGIAIQGREISRANKEQLIKEILRARGEQQ